MWWFWWGGRNRGWGWNPLGMLLFFGFLLMIGQRWALWFIVPMVFFWIIPMLLRGIGESARSWGDQWGQPFAEGEKLKNDDKRKRDLRDEPQAYALGDDGELIPVYDEDEANDDRIIYERRMKRDDTI